MEFYSSFKDENELVRWMKERPNGAAYLHEVDGDKEIIVVIPTADYEGEYAKRCREEVFKGLHIVFVESGNAPDPYFNYARNLNIGITKALEYNPKWIIYSNDDVYKIDDIFKLRNELKLLNNTVDIAFTTTGKYHSTIVELNKIKWYVRLLTGGFNNIKYEKITNLRIYVLMSLIGFGVDYIVMPEVSGYKLALYKRMMKFFNPGSFLAFRPKFLVKTNGHLFDETFVNAGEDFDLGFRIITGKEIWKQIDFRIGDIIGGSFGNTKLRAMRYNICNGVYQDMKIKNVFNIQSKK